MDNPKSHHVVKRLVTPVALWALTKVLETRRVRKSLQKLDSRTYVAKHKAAREMRRRTRRARKNGGWLAAGAAAIAVGIGLLTRATKK
jgi:hypothetical protein